MFTFVTFLLFLFSDINWQAGSNHPTGQIKPPRGPDQTTPRARSNYPAGQIKLPRGPDQTTPRARSGPRVASWTTMRHVYLCVCMYEGI